MRISARGTIGAAVAALVAAGLLTAPAGRAMVGGTLDRRAHPYVGALFYPGSPVPTCSGALVSSTRYGAVFLTAAHCVPSGVPGVSGGVRDGARVRVSFGSVATLATSIPGTFHPDPAYDASAADPHDLAIVVLDRLPDVAPIRVADVGTADRLPAGSPVTTVGYGITRWMLRDQATEVVTHADPVWLYLVKGSGNSCEFDSGGPDLVPSPRGPAVVSLTDEGNCKDAQDYRVDTVQAHRFIDGAGAAG